MAQVGVPIQAIPVEDSSGFIFREPAYASRVAVPAIPATPRRTFLSIFSSSLPRTMHQKAQMLSLGTLIVSIGSLLFINRLAAVVALVASSMVVCCCCCSTPVGPNRLYASAILHLVASGFYVVFAILSLILHWSLSGIEDEAVHRRPNSLFFIVSAILNFVLACMHLYTGYYVLRCARFLRQVSNTVFDRANGGAGDDESVRQYRGSSQWIPVPDEDSGNSAVPYAPSSVYQPVSYAPSGYPVPSPPYGYAPYGAPAASQPQVSTPAQYSEASRTSNAASDDDESVSMSLAAPVRSSHTTI